ncbi:MAG: hypothetical protein LBK53_01925, partial [Heliobacteriaceae bacterium]|nr:hypothetical protein [Heliobacteriaceae bacterium]
MQQSSVQHLPSVRGSKDLPHPEICFSKFRPSLKGGIVNFALFRHCEEGVSPTRQSSKFNGFDWIA